MSKNRIKNGEKVTGSKDPRFREDPDSFYSLNPTWRFNRLDTHHCRWRINEGEFESILLEKLVSYERMTWKDILTNTSGRRGNTQNHRVEPESLCTEAQERLVSLRLDDLAGDSLFSISLQGKIRLWGILTEGVFHIIWLDNEHEICPSKKRHT